MDTIEDKLAHCFSLAFPKLDPAAFASARHDNTEGWDSLAQLTLVTLISEEFGLDLDFEAFEDANSFEAIASRLKEIRAGG